MIRYRLIDSSYKRSYGIALLLDAFAEQAVRSIWDTLAHEGITSSLPAIVCALPHLTLSVCQQLCPQELTHRLQQFAAAVEPMQISFGALGVFPGPRGTVVFLQPTMTAELLSVHRQLYEHLQPLLIDVSPYYLPGKWMPHCSLGVGLPEGIAEQTISSCLTLRLPLLTQLQAVVLLEMLTYQRQVVAGCERLRFRLGDGQPLPLTACPKPTDCPFIIP